MKIPEFILNDIFYLQSVLVNVKCNIVLTHKSMQILRMINWECACHQILYFSFIIDARPQKKTKKNPPKNPNRRQTPSPQNDMYMYMYVYVYVRYNAIVVYTLTCRWIVDVSMNPERYLRVSSSFCF